jgi:hypothetical protein
MAAFLLYTSGWRARYGLIGSGTFVAVAVGMRMLMNYGDAREKKMKREEQRAVRGAKGEEAIGGILDSLAMATWSFMTSSRRMWTTPS